MVVRTVGCQDSGLPRQGVTKAVSLTEHVGCQGNIITNKYKVRSIVVKQ